MSSAGNWRITAATPDASSEPVTATQRAVRALIACWDLIAQEQIGKPITDTSEVCLGPSVRRPSKEDIDWSTYSWLTSGVLPATAFPHDGRHRHRLDHKLSISGHLSWSNGSHQALRGVRSTGGGKAMTG
ncbi:hypothetical protein [Streptomyces sp. NPDC003032]